MTHWSDNYVGRDYVAGRQDCAALAETVAREVLGMVVALPGERRGGVFGPAAQIARHKANVAERIDAPHDGQPVLLIARGRLQHIGVMCHLAGEWWVLHADQAAGFVVRQRLRDLPRHGYTVEGFYRWK